MFCTRCGVELADDARFCTNCGALVAGREVPVGKGSPGDAAVDPTVNLAAGAGRVPGKQATPDSPGDETTRLAPADAAGVTTPLVPAAGVTMPLTPAPGEEGADAAQGPDSGATPAATAAGAPAASTAPCPAPGSAPAAGAPDATGAPHEPGARDASRASAPRKRSRVPVIAAVVAAAVCLLAVGGVVLWRFVLSAPERSSSIERVEVDAKTPDAESGTDGGAADADQGDSSDDDTVDAAAAGDSSSADAAEAADTAGGASTDGGPGASSSSSANDYILPNSSTELLTEQDIEGLSDWELYIARNEIYARHGRGFKNKDLQEYFGSKAWYTERYTPEEFDAHPTLSDIEMKNIETIHNLEKARGSSHA